jgi:hypothetical protein
VSEDRIWQVRLPDGAIWIPEDAFPGPRAGWIYARSTAETFAKKLGGTVEEVTRRQQDKLLEREIATVLAEPKPLTPNKTRTRPFNRTARKAIAAAILENVSLSHQSRSALDTARETTDDAIYKTALRTLEAGLPVTLWIGYDADDDQGFAQEAVPIWITEDSAGEDPAAWRQIERAEIARSLVEDA